MGEKSIRRVSRRDFFKIAGATGAAIPLIEQVFTGVESGMGAEGTMKKETPSGGHVIGEAASYISKSGEAKLPPEVIKKAKHHILDTLAAVVSGSKFRAGQLALKFAKDQGGVEEAQVVGSKVMTSAINAAVANGISAHADETDDSHEPSNTHPGCAVVPAALSVAEREGVDGLTFLKGVVVGYDIGCRINRALGVAIMRSSYHSTHAIGGSFGAAAAASALFRLKEDQVRFVFDYAAQQASGIYYWVRDTEHIEKAFVFGGMPARNGVTSAMLVHLGFTGVWDCLSGDRNFFDTFSTKPNPQRLAEGLGSHFEIMVTNIKKFAVGSPIQAPLDALLTLIKKHGLKPKDVRSIAARLPSIVTVDNRDMPDVNLQYILSVALVDGDLSFEAAHSYERMKDPEVLKVKERVRLVEEPGLKTPKSQRTAVVEVTTQDGAQLKEHVVSVRGTAENPMSTEEVEKKCRELLIPVLGKDRSEKLIDAIWNIEKVKNARELRPLLSVS